MQQFKLRQFFALALSLFSLACTSIDEAGQPKAAELPATLEATITTAYDRGAALLLFAYDDGIAGTEAYADWSAYLNDVNTQSKAVFQIFRVKPNALVTAIPMTRELTEFTVFLKKGMPTYLYEDLIVEPQVYTAVEHVYEELPITNENKAFLPEEVILESN